MFWLFYQISISITKVPYFLSQNKLLGKEFKHKKDPYLKNNLCLYFLIQEQCILDLSPPVESEIWWISSRKYFRGKSHVDFCAHFVITTHFVHSTKNSKILQTSKSNFLTQQIYFVRLNRPYRFKASCTLWYVFPFWLVPSVQS